MVDQEVNDRQLKMDRFPFQSEGEITLAVRNANYTLGPVMFVDEVTPDHIERLGHVMRPNLRTGLHLNVQPCSVSLRWYRQRMPATQCSAHGRIINTIASSAVGSISEARVPSLMVQNLASAPKGQRRFSTRVCPESSQPKSEMHILKS